MEKRKIAITDIDGTHFRASLMDVLIEELLEKEIFTKEIGSQYFKAQDGWKDRENQNSFLNFQRIGIDTIITHIAGKEVYTLQKASRTVLEKHKSRTYEFSRWLYRELRKEGYKIGAVSHSPNFIVEQFAINIENFDFSYGSYFGIDKSKGIFTGEVVAYPKNETITKLLADNPEYCMEESFGIGDTASDTPMFRLVKYPICFNPSGDLYEEAVANNWPIVVERKDVVYLNGKRFDWRNLELSDFMNLAYK